jgi:hypothetical protein
MTYGLDFRGEAVTPCLNRMADRLFSQELGGIFFCTDSAGAPNLARSELARFVL